jgi:hypothetical protein
MLSSADLRQKLSLSRREFDKLVAEGLPHEKQGRALRFEPQAVADWLRANKKVKPAGDVAPVPSPPTEQIVRTRHEVATHFGVSLRTVAEWLTDPSFPGRAGNRGRRDGEFPLLAIKAWWDAKRGTTVAPDASQSAKDRLNEVRARRAEIELEQLLGTLIEVEEVERFISRTIATAKAVLDQLSDQVLACLPPAVDVEARRKVRERVVKVLDDTYATLAELAEADQDNEPEAP